MNPLRTKSQSAKSTNSAELTESEEKDSEVYLAPMDESEIKTDSLDENSKSIKRIAEFYGLNHEQVKEIIHFYSRAMTRLMFIIENSPSERTSLMGIKLLHSIVSAQPKGPLIAIQNNLGNAGYGSYEEMLRQARELLAERERKAIAMRKITTDGD